jgi:hypothetical protein
MISDEQKSNLSEILHPSLFIADLSLSVNPVFFLAIAMVGHVNQHL